MCRVVCRTAFHRSQMEKARNVEGKITDHGWNRLAGLGMQTFNIVLLVALVSKILRTDSDDPETFRTKVKIPPPFFL